jgi:DNA-binding response OmpR family regulator
MKVLIIEDERRIALSIQKGLQLERITVDTAFTGTDGYDLASTETYDVIVLDRMLPHMDGLDICRRLRAKKVRTPILILTAKGQTHEKVSGLEAGADDYLAKPFSFEELLARIRALARRPNTLTDERLVVAELELDPTTFEVKRGNQVIHLTNKEFALLEYLMRNAGRTLSKDMIINHVWDYDADILPNTVEVYIRNLRNKIDTPFVKYKPLIHTKRGFGYKIQA